NEELHGERSLIPVQFAVPYDLPPSGGDVRWTLTARAATAGVDYFAQFEVPVFATDASSPHLTTQAAAKLMADEDPVDFATVARRLAARVEEQTHDRRVLRFPPARNRGLALFISLFAIGWIAACAGLFISDAPRLFPWVFSAFGALIAWMAVVTCARNTQLQYSPRGVAFTHRLLGFGRRHEVPREQIAAIAVARSGVTYKGRAFSRVELTTVAGRRHTLVSDIERRRDAEALAADIETIVGLSESRTGGQASRMPLEQSLPADWRAD
ncbi:MAG TPA: hypothetical protein PJ982_17685, partial [Lacipirellulaceae bacterium]|nr:hypothetical protein [Lacipirellulaceae bacterium]